MAEYTIKIEAFEGPMDLLMHLIEKNKLDIYDIPIAMITEQYIGYLNSLRDFNMEIASEFLVMAATLLQIKSRMLLPKRPAVIEAEEADPRQELVNRLIEYKKFKEAAGSLQVMLSERGQYYTRIPQEFAVQYVLPTDLQLDTLIAAFAAVWESQELETALITPEEISVRDKMQDILHLLLQQGGRLEFKQALIRSRSRSELIAAFLAMLELIRLRRIAVEQHQPFADIFLVLKPDTYYEQESDLF